MSVGHSRCALPDGGHADGGGALEVTAVALLVFATPAQQLVVEVPAEALAQQVKGEGVHAGAGETQHARHERDDEVRQRRVDLSIVERAVHVEDVVGEPAQREEAHEHQDDLG